MDDLGDQLMHRDWFFGDPECLTAVHSLLLELNVPILSKDSLPIDLSEFSILDIISTDLFTFGDDGYRPESRITYRVQYKNDRMKGELLPILSKTTDRIVWLMSLSIQHALANLSPLFVPLIGADYFSQPQSMSKVSVG